MLRINRRRLLGYSRMALASVAAAGLAACGAAPAPTGVPPEPRASATPEPTEANATTEPAPAETGEPRAESLTPSAAPAEPTAALAADTPAAAPAATTAAAVGDVYLAVARGSSPAAITEAAINAIGGIERFVKAGDDVIVKPNICNAYHGPEYASTTNPEVVATIVSLCRAAGARRVRIVDYPFGGTPEDAYVTSGIKDAVEAAGGEMEVMSPLKFAEVDFPPESVEIRKWPVFQDALKVDALINVPIAKHHGDAVLTLGCKNMMGLVEQRNLIHMSLHQRIADLVALFRPTLTVVDAVRILMANGPTGGSLGDVKEMNTVIASHDIVAADAYATTMFPFADTDKVAYIKLAADMGLGTRDLTSAKVQEIEV